MSRNRLVGYVLGVVYLIVGVVGFVVVSDFVETNTDEKLFGIFEINGLHNVVHLGVGAALLGAAVAGFRAARSMNLAVGGTYLLVGIIGLFIANDTNSANILSLNGADNVLHIASSLVLLGVALSEKTDVEVARENDRDMTRV